MPHPVAPIVAFGIGLVVQASLAVHRARPWVSWFVPTASVVAFTVLYGVAAWLYPGGTRSEPQRVGFSFVRNYWCDLLDATTYAGVRNPARPVAMAAMLLLCMGLAMLWWSVPVLFSSAPRRGMLVRAAGVGSALVMPCVGTALHDLAIDVAGGFGLVGFLVTASRLGDRGRALTAVTWSTLLAALANFAMWQTGSGLALLPLVQKVAFAFFLGWVVLIAGQLRRVARTKSTMQPLKRGDVSGV